jgi:hypothetical protein
MFQHDKTLQANTYTIHGGSKWLALRSGHFTPGKRISSTYYREVNGL